MADQGSIEQVESRGSAKMDQVRSQATEKIRGAKQAGVGYMQQQQRMAAIEIDGYACALRQTAKTLHDQSQEGAGYYAERAASALDALARNLRDKEVGEVAGRVRDGISGFARRQPGLFIGGAIAAGFMVSRLMRGTAGELVKERSGWSAESDIARSDTAGADTGIQSATSPAPVVSEGTGVTEAPGAGPYTAADVEVPVILQPHEPVHPRGPNP